MINKASLEIGLVETTRRLYPWFPRGELSAGKNPPDVVLASEGEHIAIEVTQLFHPAAPTSKYPRQQIAQFRRDVATRAQAIATAEGLPVYDVLVYFWNDEPLVNLESAARALVEFVKSHPVDDCQTWDRFDVPFGFGVIRIARPTANHIPYWRGHDGGSEPTLTREFVAAYIARKNARLNTYRDDYDQAWLILISTLFPLSSSFSVPAASNEWEFEFDFDKVLLVSEQYGVFNLTRAVVEAKSHA
jgi:hypothetical protein